MKELRVGIVGVGGISNNHEAGYNRVPGVTITAMCDILPDRLAARSERAGIDDKHRFADYRDLINCPDVDALSITTPNNVHHEVVMAAIAAGKPFAVEKPVTNDYASAKELADRVESLAHMVCFSYRFQHAARFAKHIVQSGELGRIFHIDGYYQQAWGINPNGPLVWRFVKEIAGSGALGDLGCHLIDLTRFITGEEFADVIAKTGTFIKERKLPDGTGMGNVDVDDYVDILSDMSGGGSANLHITRYGYGRGNAQELIIYGEKGAIRYSLEGESALEICTGSAMGQSHTWAKLALPQQFKGDQMQSFINIVRGEGDGLPATLEDGAINAKIVDAILESAQAARPIKI